MSHKPFKFRYASELAGAFVLLSIALVIGGVALAGRARGWFTRTTTVSLVLPEEGTMGLKEGADVFVLGTAVGSVRDISVDADGRMVARAVVRSDFARFVRVDSEVFVRKALGIGDAYVEIKRGKGAAAEEGATLAVREDKGTTELVEGLITDMRKEMVPAVQEIRAAAKEYGQLAADLRDPKGDLRQTVARLNAIATAVERGDGLVGRLLTDKELANAGNKVNVLVDQLNALVADLNKTAALLPDIAQGAGEQAKKLPEVMKETQQALADVRVILADVRKSTTDLPQTLAAIRQTAEGLPGVVLQTQETMRQIQRLVEGVQRNFLVRPYMDGDAAPGRIAPDRAGGR